MGPSSGSFPRPVRKGVMPRLLQSPSHCEGGGGGWGGVPLGSGPESCGMALRSDAGDRGAERAPKPTQGVSSRTPAPTQGPLASLLKGSRRQRCPHSASQSPGWCTLQLFLFFPETHITQALSTSDLNPCCCWNPFLFLSPPRTDNKAPDGKARPV